ncbi:hypothetical protein QFC22_001749 [Naganishia vaughanmartiniae]|uniref:Uncharacterized protein n=1 Tax=Naganishia vaughanmartiniae TaxID=1424756 RepID=A0ACC2XFB4_9TREE|nr:hypothetical protein QFC22_001749 [Naganishia vaughanmartiniae]
MVNAQPVTELLTSSSTETMVDGINNLKMDEAKPTDNTAAAAAATVEENGQSQSQQEGESQLARLHRLCAEGDVMGVRGILSQSLELLESIDLTTGWTPMLQAIYGGQVEVVRELLLAGAYPPPPSVTSDPAILSLLYPQQPYSQQQQGPPGAVPVNGEPSQAPFHHGMHHSRMSVSGNGSHETTHKLPPIEVSRTIPCRNFPNCRYGDACIFQHPVALPAGAPGAGGPAFFPSPYPTEFVPGFGAAAYIPGGFPQGAPMQQMYYPPYPPAPHMAAAGPFVPLDGQARGPSPHSAPFVPFIPTSGSSGVVGVSPSGNQLALDGSMTAEATGVTPEGESATGEAPAADSAAGQTAPQLAPRQSVSGGFPGHLPFYAGSNNVGFEPRRHGHMKKMSFGAAKHGGLVNARAAVLGTWTNGQPPPCVFFQNSKCRNGEMCKFPHIAADGTDCRHPDVINGNIAPAPISLGGNNNHPNAFRGPRGRGAPSVNAGHFERHQHVQAMKAQGAAAARNATANNSVENDATAAAAPVDSPVASDDDAQESKPADETSSNETKVEEQTSDASLTTQPKSTVTRSVPNTRAGSPNNAHGGNNFRNGRTGRVPHQNGRENSRSTSIPAGQREAKQQQKLPSADDFPALSGSTGSLMSDSMVMVKPAAFNGKTAAQVLSAPAPPKPVAAPVKSETETKTEDTDKDFERVSASPSTNDVTTESDDEAVIISHTPTPAPRPESKPAPLSFAAAAAAVASSEPAVLVASTA